MLVLVKVPAKGEGDLVGALSDVPLEVVLIGFHVAEEGAHVAGQSIAAAGGHGCRVEGGDRGTEALTKL